MINLQNISVTRGEKNIIHDLSLSIDSGKLTILMGPNGAGKSTLLEVFSGQIIPDRGTIIWEGESFQKWAPVKLAQRRTVMSQKVNLSFPIQIEQLVDMGCYAAYQETKQEERGAIVEYALNKVGLRSFIGRDYNTLSGGEQQRVLMAKCIAQLECHYWRPQPQYLFLDEATAGLDVKQKNHLFKLVKEIIARRGIGVLAIVHDLQLAAQYADEIILMKDGEIIAEGPKSSTLSPQKLVATFGMEEAYFAPFIHATRKQQTPGEVSL